jgi:molybdopterin synthase catalytic subunit
MAMKLPFFHPSQVAKPAIMNLSISIQTDDFSHSDEYQTLCNDAPSIGAIVTFCGLVREFDDGRGEALFLEHFEGMTEKTLTHICEQAAQRWPIISARIIHRIGPMNLGEQIVFVGINSAHRKAAFHACEFIMDFLKTDAPFWKKAITSDSEYWVEAKTSDQAASETWKK